VQTIRLGLRATAILGATSIAALAAAPALAADPVSQATAQSLDLTIGGQSAISQLITATSDGTSQTKTDGSTVPTIAGLLPGNNALGVGVAPQDAGANTDGTSYACAGIAGTGGGIVHTGSTSCDIDGAPITLNLGTLSLGSQVVDPQSALGAALAQTPLGSALNTLLTTVQSSLVKPLTSSLATTPLDIQLGGTLSAIEAQCTANPTAASGSAHLVDTHGGSTPTPITVTVGGQSGVIANLPVNPAANTHLPTQANALTQTVIDALKVELNTAIGGQLQPLAGALGSGLQQVQDAIVNQLITQLQPVLQPLQQQILDITLNKQVSSDSGRKIDVTALDLQLLPAAAQFTGSSLVAGQFGHVTCGPNAGRAVTTPQATALPASSSSGSSSSSSSDDDDSDTVPTSVNAGLAGDDQDNTGFYLGLGGLVAVGAAGTAYAYRRFAAK